MRQAILFLSLMALPALGGCAGSNLLLHFPDDQQADTATAGADAACPYHQGLEKLKHPHSSGLQDEGPNRVSPHKFGLWWPTGAFTLD